MSEGTMQRRAQREQPERAKRLTRVLVCAAAVPVMLVATGCSSDSGPDDGGGDKAASASASASPSPTVQAAAYRTLPEACRALSKKTLEDLAPKAKSGKEGGSDDVASRASCSWSSLDNNGVKGSQFRWLNVSLLRFESDTTRGPGDKLAQEYYDKQVREVRATPGAKGLNAQAVAGTGDEATAVRYELKKKEGTFKQQTVVVRVENVVVTLDYNGAGLAGDKTPDAAALLADAKKAAKEAVLSVTRANGPAAASGSPSAPASGRPSAPASKAPSASASGKS
ncbi:DUF3558 family protein [Streptomyces sp. I5]|uniref:DUF3558 family protein n=1 Tax=Streptomyces sp. I5 TaxID=2759947 RepID=UPI0018EE5D9B|nr:DUF3558 family protein [Streptomyces sp. I5]